MRFRLTLEVDKKAFGNILPINYQYEQSAVIYKIISKSNEKYSSWLHNNGYSLENGKAFKLFTYSPFEIEKYRIDRETARIRIESSVVKWEISFLPEESTQEFILGVFKEQSFEIGNKGSVVRFVVKNVEAIPMPEFKEEMFFEAVSPVCIKCKNPDNTVTYLSPDNWKAEDIIKIGLLARYEIVSGKKYDGTFNDFSVKVLSEPKSKLIRIKSGTAHQTSIRGYVFKFKIKAPVELINIMYNSGMGSLCSQGFGFIKEITPSM